MDHHFKPEIFKSAIIARITSGQKITAHWDAGGDECLVDVMADGAVTGNECSYLGDCIEEVLQLPSAGEDFVQGSGEVFIRENQLWMKYRSEAFGEEGLDHEGAGERGADSWQRKVLEGEILLC
jgi:hypothetical protein